MCKDPFEESFGWLDLLVMVALFSVVGLVLMWV